MTLILSCLTSKYAIQVSDRRLTLTNGEIYDEQSNKAILVNGHMIFGYTGLAYIDNGIRSDEWFLNSLVESYKNNPKSSLTSTAEFIAQKASKTMSRLKISPENKRLAWVGIGWAKLTGTTQLLPTYLCISNMHDDRGKPLKQACSKFSVLPFTPLDDTPVMLIPNGQSIQHDLASRLKRLLRKCVERDLNPTTLARVLVGAVRKVASNNVYVGKNLLVSAIPKDSVHLGRLKLLGFTPQKNIATFSYVPENTMTHVQYGPNVFHHGVIGTDIKAYQERQ